MRTMRKIRTDTTEWGPKRRKLDFCPGKGWICEICNLGCVGWNRHLLVACTYLIKVGGLAFKYCNQITIKQDKASVGWWSTCALTATGAKYSENMHSWWRWKCLILF
jgi:hypothetical protein